MGLLNWKITGIFSLFKQSQKRPKPWATEKGERLVELEQDFGTQLGDGAVVSALCWVLCLNFHNVKPNGDPKLNSLGSAGIGDLGSTSLDEVVVSFPDSLSNALHRIKTKNTSPKPQVGTENPGLCLSVAVFQLKQQTASPRVSIPTGVVRNLTVTRSELTSVLPVCVQPNRREKRNPKKPGVKTVGGLDQTYPSLDPSGKLSLLLENDSSSRNITHPENHLPLKNLERRSSFGTLSTYGCGSIPCYPW